MKQCAEEFLKRNYKVLNGRKPTSIDLNINGWYRCCPACFTEYINNGICGYCGLEIEIEERRTK